MDDKSGDAQKEGLRDGQNGHGFLPRHSCSHVWRQVAMGASAIVPQAAAILLDARMRARGTDAQDGASQTSSSG